MSVSFEGIREDFFSELMAWAAECGASCDGFEISNFADEGYGLKATKDIKVGVFPDLVRILRISWMSRDLIISFWVFLAKIRYSMNQVSC